MVKFAELTNQNPWWKYENGFQRFDKHLTDLDQHSIKIGRKHIRLQQGDIVIIRGCRQIGKTTYIKQIVAKLIDQGAEPRTIMYLSVDQLIKTRRELRNAIDLFLTRNLDAEQVHIILDEITSLKDWNQELKTLSDTGATRKARVLVTGSSGAALRDTGEQLPGRGLEGNEYNLKPLTFREFINQTIDHFKSHSTSAELAEALKLLKKNLPAAKISLREDISQIALVCGEVLPYQRELSYLFDHYLRCGGFPASINSYLTKDKHKVDPTVAENFMRIILGALSDYGKNEATARQLLDEILAKYGTMYSFTRLSDQVNHVTTGDYLDYLEKSFIIHIHYALDLNKKTVKYKGRKKVLFQDPFIYYSTRSWLRGTDINSVISETFNEERQISQVVEAIVTSHLTTSSETPIMREKNTFSWFYYDNRGREIDNIVKNNGDYDAVEVKYRNNVTSSDVTRLQGVRQTIMLSRYDFSVTGKTIVIPVSVYLSLLERSEKNL